MATLGASLAGWGWGVRKHTQGPRGWTLTERGQWEASVSTPVNLALGQVFTTRKKGSPTPMYR